MAISFTRGWHHRLAMYKQATDDEIATGGDGIARRLDAIDVPARLRDLPKEIRTAKGQKLSNLQREYRYLSALKKMGKSPKDAYTLSKIPVLPSAFRPIYPDKEGKLVVPPINTFYRNLGAINAVLADKSLKLPRSARNATQKDLYDATTHIMGTVGTPHWMDGEGILKTITGTSSPKSGFFQSQIISRRQQISGRSTITVDPNLGVDEIGMPEDMAWTVYQPFIMRELHRGGMPVSGAMKAIEDRNSQAQQALSEVMQKRPALINRAPSLHKFSVMAVKPKLAAGRDIKVNPFIIGGLGADFDGDTTSIHIPMTEDARKESFNMLPSRHLLKPGTHEIMLKPTQAAHLGLFMLSRPQKQRNMKSYRTSEDALKAHKVGEVETEHAIRVGGKTTSAGRLFIAKALPKNLRDFDTLDKGGIEAMLKNVAQRAPSQYGKVVDKLRRLGDEHITYRGFSIGLDDLSPIKERRDKALKVAEMATTKAMRGRANTMENRREVAGKVYGKIQQDLNAYIGSDAFVNKNTLAQMVRARSRGSVDQVRQIVATPLMAEDPQDRLIPIPIQESYSEGVDMQGYWAAAHGVRKGMVGRSKQTSIPGALAKEILASISDVVITSEQGNPASITLPLDRTDDVVDRYVAADVRGKSGRVLLKKDTLLTTDTIARLRGAGAKKVAVYTPLNSETASGGMPRKAFGLNERGKLPDVGDNVGVLSGQAITEPISQMTMKSFHSGGTIGAGANIPEGFPRIQQILELPENVIGKATLAETKGRVTKIEKSSVGGSNVFVDQTRHYVPRGRQVKVKKGQRVAAGDTLSDGVIKPQEMIQHKPIEAVQEYMVDELQTAMAQGGTPTRRKYIETIVAGMTNRSEVVDPGSYGDALPGDVVPNHIIRSHNAKKNVRPIEAKPLLKGVGRLPIIKASDNWLAGMNFQQLGNVLREAITAGGQADIHSYQPIAALAHGVEFGQGEKGKY